MKRIIALMALAALLTASIADAQTRKTKRAARPAKARTSVTAKSTVPGSDLPLFEVKGKVKSITEKTFVETEEPLLDAAGNPVFKDGYMQTTGKIKLDPSGQTTYLFSPEGFLTGFQQTDYEGNAVKDVQTKDADGRLKTVVYEGFSEGEPRTERLTVKRDASGRATAFLIVDKNHPQDVVWNYTITYLPDGKFSKIRNVTEYDTWTSVYSYNANGHIIKRTNRNGAGNNIVEYTYSGEKDVNGNWLRRSYDGTTYVREIEYYE